MTQSLSQTIPPSQQLLKQWIQRHLDLLLEERKEEQTQSRLLLSKTAPKVLERNGLALLGLGVASVRIGLGAKFLVELERPSAYHTSSRFPSHSFRPGDLAQIQDHNLSPLDGKLSKWSSSSSSQSIEIQGVVYRVSDTRIIIAVDERTSKNKTKIENNITNDTSDKRNAKSGDSTKVSNDDLQLPERIRIIKVANEATFDRMEKAMKKLADLLGIVANTSFSSADDSEDEKDDKDEPQTVSTNDLSHGANRLIRSLVGLEKPEWNHPSVELPLPLFNNNLNDSQIQAIRTCLSASQLSLIHGPPGTGKTTTIVELIMQMVGSTHFAASEGQPVRILVCGASNLAVDNLLEKIVGRPEHRDILKKRGAGVTRLGHPARVLAGLQTSTLDAQTTASDEGQLVQDVAKEIESTMSQLKSPPTSSTAGNKSSRNQPRLRGADRRKKWQDVRQLRKEYRRRERGVTNAILDRAQIVVATCHGAGGKQLANRWFDVVIIDEACQALEAACWIPILKIRPGGKVILAGDHLQLPPTVKSDKTGHHQNRTKKKKKTPSNNQNQATSSGTKKESPPDEKSVDAEKKEEEQEEGEDDDDEDDSCISTFDTTSISTKSNSKTRQPTLRPPRSLSTTLFSRLLGLYGPAIKSLLSVQYRMNSTIMSFPNTQLYEGQLTAHESCSSIQLSDLLFPSSTNDNKEKEELNDLITSVVFYDTAGCEMYEQSDQQQQNTSLNSSRFNENEANLVLKHVELLLSFGISSCDIAILSPYSSQVNLISSLINDSYSGIEIGTVDGMQGREKQVIILSLVRSNSFHQVGFLSDPRRLNVAITRAKRQLVVIGDSDTVGSSSSGDDFLSAWIKWLDIYATVEPVVTM